MRAAVGRWLVASLCLAITLSTLSSSRADPAASEPATRERVNAGAVGIISGGVDGTYVRFAADLAAVLDEPDGLRILPFIGKGSLQNVTDILFLKGVDIGIVQSDALAYAKRTRLYPGLGTSLRYVAKLYNEEFHVLATRRIGRLADLSGRRVNTDLRGSGTAMTAVLVFDELGIHPDITSYDQALALEKLRRGEIDALVYVAGKPARLFRDIAPEEGLHFLSVPLTPTLMETYMPSDLTANDYPQLIHDAPVGTVSVGSVMAVYNWRPGTDRYRRVARFVDAFFDKFSLLLAAPRHPKWREVNLGSEVPGWVRFDAAEKRLVAASARQPDAAATMVVSHAAAGARGRMQGP